MSALYILYEKYERVRVSVCLCRFSWIIFHFSIRSGIVCKCAWTSRTGATLVLNVPMHILCGGFEARPRSTGDALFRFRITTSYCSQPRCTRSVGAHVYFRETSSHETLYRFAQSGYCYGRMKCSSGAREKNAINRSDRCQMGRRDRFNQLSSNCERMARECPWFCFFLRRTVSI